MNGLERTARWRVTGEVQGVGFRWWCSQQAGQFGLRGWVRNRPDGTVEVVALGSKSAVGELERRIQIGPASASVHSVVEVIDSDPIGSIEGFEIR